jgi:hypothetical protein
VGQETAHRLCVPHDYDLRSIDSLWNALGDDNGGALLERRTDEAMSVDRFAPDCKVSEARRHLSRVVHEAPYRKLGIGV